VIFSLPSRSVWEFFVVVNFVGIPQVCAVWTHNGDELTLPDVLPGFKVEAKRFFE
jgi:hypothetical protein